MNSSKTMGSIVGDSTPSENTKMAEHCHLSSGMSNAHALAHGIQFTSRMGEETLWFWELTSLNFTFPTIRTSEWDRVRGQDVCAFKGVVCQTLRALDERKFTSDQSCGLELCIELRVATPITDIQRNRNSPNVS